MVRRVATRSQRRLVKKQAVLLLALVLVASLLSFALGVMVGRSGSRADVIVTVPPPARQPVAPPPPSATTVAAGAQPTESLTFYDSLPKGGQAPLGSGINLPPAKSPAPAATPPDEPATPAPPAAGTSMANAPVAEAPPPAKPAAPASQKAAAASVAKPPAPAAAPPAAGGAYLVQAAAFRRAEDARALQAKLSKKGYAAFTEAVALGEKGIWYRVYVGPLATAGAAEAAVARLKAEEKLSALVRKR